MVCIWVFPKIVVPQIIHFNRVFHYKPSILGYPYFWKHLCMNLEDHPSLPRTCKWLIINNLEMAWAFFSMGGGDRPPFHLEPENGLSIPWRFGDSIVRTWNFTINLLGCSMFGLSGNVSIIGKERKWEVTCVTFGYISIFQKELFFGVPA